MKMPPRKFNEHRKGLIRALASVIAVIVLSLWPLKDASGVVQLFPQVQEAQPTHAQLIDGVNNLRISHGLNPLIVHPILMQTAQQQADALLASDGAVGHSRPGGIGYTDQLLLLGYPLAGDLSLGGYRAENFISAFAGMTVQAAIEMWMGDGPHANTMLSPYYQNIGAGIAFDSEGNGYLVINCAMPTASGQPQKYTPASPIQGGAAGVLDMSQYMQPIFMATARPDGDVIYEVQYGQSLWGIAIAYGTKINEIQRLNNLSDTTIYSGQKLLIQKGATQPPPTASEAAAITPTHQPKRTTTPSPVLQTVGTSTAAIENSRDPTVVTKSGLSMITIVGGAALLTIVIAGFFRWLSMRAEKKE